ncbi:MAG: hypothetical protein OEY94_08475 [Alphaproteobacteria bacterium]|nr:hypothetical protein [Alphaproteobacteria bacterium]
MTNEEEYRLNPTTISEETRKPGDKDARYIKLDNGTTLAKVDLVYNPDNPDIISNHFVFLKEGQKEEGYDRDAAIFEMRINAIKLATIVEDMGGELYMVDIGVWSEMPVEQLIKKDTAFSNGGYPGEETPLSFDATVKNIPKMDVFFDKLLKEGMISPEDHKQLITDWKALKQIHQEDVEAGFYKEAQQTDITETVNTGPTNTAFKP